MESIKVSSGDVELHVNVSGEGPTVLLLHGWPDTSALWNGVASDLVTAGYRVAVPDLRGCGLSDKPTDVTRYAMHELVSDVACIIAALGDEKVTLVGHDWGANLAWVTATYRPDLVGRLVVVSVGHPTSFRSAGLEQQIKSWYTLLFFHEGVGEAFLRKNDYEAMRRWTGHPRVEEIILELERDGQMTTHLLWYRANLPPESFVADPPILPPVEVPVLGLWSSGDAALSEHQMTNSSAYCAQGFTYVRFEGPGHWLPIEAPHDVSAAIVKFISASA
ncbi:MAG TPA: alpha/beta fold hydrolase [Acidimicrobiales bacterium]